MPDDNRNQQNQPHSRKGKKQSPSSGVDNKQSKPSRGPQARRNRPEGDYGAIAEDEGSSQGIAQRKDNPNRQKAGR
jgi:hypothetical protein